MNRTTLVLFTVIFALTIGLLMLIVPESKLITQTYAQSNNETSEGGMKNMTNATTPLGKIPSMSTPGEKTFYIFTSEVENIDENKLKVAGDSYSVPTLIVNKGDKVTVNFYNVDDVKTERHSFTIGDPYKVDIDLRFRSERKRNLYGGSKWTIYLLLQISFASYDGTIASTTITHISNAAKKVRQDLN